MFLLSSVHKFGWIVKGDFVRRNLHKSHYCSGQSAAALGIEASHPHPNLPPSRGKGLLQSSFVRIRIYRM